MEKKKKGLPKWLAWIFLILLVYGSLAVLARIYLMVISNYILLMAQNEMPYLIGEIIGTVLFAWLFYKGIKKCIKIIKKKG